MTINRTRADKRTYKERRAYFQTWRINTYYRKKEAMIKALGGVCVQCGATDELQFNHIYERFWTPREVNSIDRLKQYQAEIDQGKINLLCRDCNAVYEPLPLPAGEVPF